MRRTIGIDLGSYSVKFSVLEKVNNYYYVKYKKSYPVPREDDLDYGEWLKSVIADFMKQNQIGKADLCFNFAEQTPQTIVRFFEMPKLSRKEIAQSMVYEIEEKTLIEDLKSIFYKWSILSQDAENNNILLVITEKDFILDLKKKIKNRKWKIKAIEPQIVSAGRLITGNAGVIDFGHNGTRFTVYKDGKPYFFKEISIGGKDLTQRIADYYADLGLVKDEKERLQIAERLKHEKGCILSGYEDIESDPVSRELSHLLEEPVQNLVNEIKQAFRMFEMRDDYAFEKLYYTGDGAKLRYLVNLVERELNFDLEPLNRFVPESDENGESHEGNGSFIFAHGSALYNDFPYLNSLNFALVRSYKPDFKNLLAGTLAFSLLFNLGLVGTDYIVNRRLDTANAEINKQRQQLASIQRQINDANKVINDYKDLESFVRFILDQKKWLSDILYVLPSYTTDGVVIKSMTIKDGQIVMKGYAKNYSQVGFFAISLEKLGRVKIDSVENMTDSSVFLSKRGDLTKQFTITLYLDGNNEAEDTQLVQPPKESAASKPAS